MLNVKKKNYCYFLLKSNKNINSVFIKNKFNCLNINKNINKNIIYDHQLFFNFNIFLKFFNDHLIKKDFLLYVMSNDIKTSFFNNLLSFFNNDVKQKLYYFKNQFCIYFYFILFCFLYYKNNQIIIDFIFFFVRKFNYKTQRILNTMYISSFAFIKTKTIRRYGLLGCQIKIKGKYTQRPGDRRKVYFYRIGAFSYSNPVNKYVISHKQLRDKSGASGCTVITMLI